MKSHYVIIELNLVSQRMSKAKAEARRNSMEWDMQICGRARGSKALVPLASLSRALLKRLKAQPRAVR